MEWSGKVSEERTFDLKMESEGISHMKWGESLLSRGNACAKGLNREQAGFFKRKEANNMGHERPEGGGSRGGMRSVRQASWMRLGLQDPGKNNLDDFLWRMRSHQRSLRI